MRKEKSVHITQSNLHRTAGEKELEDAKEWRYVETIYWADNSEEEIWENKYGERKSVMTVYSHGDVC